MQIICKGITLCKLFKAAQFSKKKALLRANIVQNIFSNLNQIYLIQRLNPAIKPGQNGPGNNSNVQMIHMPEDNKTEASSVSAKYNSLETVKK